MNKLRSWAIALLVGMVALIVLSMGFLYSFAGSSWWSPRITGFRKVDVSALSGALIVKTSANEAVVVDHPSPGPVVVKTKPKVQKIFRPVSPTPQATPQAPQNSSFPACFREVGWYYGYHPGAFEYGTDFDCGYRTNVPALWGGVVTWSGRTWWNGSTAGGLVVIAAYVPGLGFESTYYLHLDWNNVLVGQHVAKGQVVGLSGGQVGYGNWPTSPQYTSGPHLEMGFCYPFEPFTEGHNTNPLPYINQALGV